MRQSEPEKGVVRPGGTVLSTRSASFRESSSLGAKAYARVMHSNELGWRAKMAAGTSLKDQRDPDTLRILGAVNLLISGVGLIQLVVNVVAYHGLPPWFIDEYGPFMRQRFPAMATASALLLGPLAYTGIQLVRRKRHAVLLCNVVFLAEITYFVFLWRTWSLGLSLFSPIVIIAGLMNIGLALQIVTAYPIIGLILLGVSRRRMHDIPN